MNPQLYTRHPDEIEKVKEVQQLLVELGPVLVEMGKLQPSRPRCDTGALALIPLFPQF